MSGLIEKDLRILLQRKQTLIVFVAIAVIMSLTQGGSFIIGYMTFISVILAVSTISYDEFDNGYPFLFTLPITRKAYVAEKYIISILTIVVSWLLSLVLCFMVDAILEPTVSATEILIMAVIIIPLPVLLMDIMIPVQLKYGAEKSRLVIIAVVGICAIVVYGIIKILEQAGIPLAAIINKLDRIPDVAACPALVVIGIVVTLFSLAISNAIMAKKEF